MPNRINVTYSNYVAGAGIANATTDITINYFDDAGNPQVFNRTGVSLANVCTDLNGKTDANQKRNIFYHIMQELLAMDAGVTDLA